MRIVATGETTGGTGTILPHSPLLAQGKTKTARTVLSSDRFREGRVERVANLDLQCFHRTIAPSIDKQLDRMYRKARTRQQLLRAAKQLDNTVLQLHPAAEQLDDQTSLEA